VVTVSGKFRQQVTTVTTLEFFTQSDQQQLSTTGHTTTHLFRAVVLLDNRAHRDYKDTKDLTVSPVTRDTRVYKVHKALLEYKDFRV
jgi:hypothetical protein